MAPPLAPAGHSYSPLLFSLEVSSLPVSKDEEPCSVEPGSSVNRKFRDESGDLLYGDQCAARCAIPELHAEVGHALRPGDCTPLPTLSTAAASQRS